MMRMHLLHALKRFAYEDRAAFMATALPPRVVKELFQKIAEATGRPYDENDCDLYQGDRSDCKNDWRNTAEHWLIPPC
jgi:hypothetical protein